MNDDSARRDHQGGSESASGSWVKHEISDDEAEEYMRFLSDRVRIVAQSKLSGGFSGAHTRKILVDGENPYKLAGQYVLKICLARDAENELRWHSVARNSKQLKGHVPDCSGKVESSDGHLVGVFYHVAGRDINDTTTLSSRYERENHFSPTRLRSIAASVLKHNLSAIDDVTVTNILREEPPHNSGPTLEGCPRTVIAQICYWLEHHRLRELDTILQQVLYDPQAWKIMLSDPLDATWLLNPFPFVDQPTIAPLDPESASPGGLLHGDLHPGNVIVPVDAESDNWYLIDFAAGRQGSAFFDLAYLELSIVLSMLDRLRGALLETWWAVENLLQSKMCPKKDAHLLISLVLPIRRALEQHARLRNREEDFWNAYLAASVEAGLRLTRALQFDERRRRIAFLTAASRFHCLAGRATEQQKSIRQAIGERGRCVTTEVRWQDKSDANRQTRERPTNIGYPLPPWPEGGWERTELYDPGPDSMTDRLQEALRHSTGIALIGERKSGKSSYMNVVQTLLERQNKRVVFFRVPTLGFDYSARFFAGALWRSLTARLDINTTSGGLHLNSQDEIECEDLSALPKLVTMACNAVLPGRAKTTCVLLLDEFDSVVTQARSREEASVIVELVRFLAESSLLCPFLTLSEERVIRECKPHGEALLSRLDSYTIPMWSKEQVSYFIQHLDRDKHPLYPSIHFSDEAIEKICFYSGWQISVAKLVVFALLTHSMVGREEKLRVTGDMVEASLRAVAQPDEYIQDFPRSGDVYNKVFGKHGVWRQIFLAHFNEDEKEAALRMSAAEGMLLVNPSASDAMRVQRGAESLEHRGYLTRIVQSGSDLQRSYTWRIGFWKLVVQDYARSRGTPSSAPSMPPAGAKAARAFGSNPGVDSAYVDGYSLHFKDGTVVDLGELEALLLGAAMKHGVPVTFDKLVDLVRDHPSRLGAKQIKMLLESIKRKVERHPSGKGILAFDAHGLTLLDVSM